MPVADNGSVRIHYQTGGIAGRDVLVLSNSLGSNLHMWDKVLPRLESTCQIVRYDTRGHGLSSVPSGPYTLDQMGSDLLFLLDLLGLQRVNLCGLSLGGMVGMWMGLHAPQRIRRLIFANTGARILTPELWDQRIETVHNIGMASLATATLERWFTPHYRKQHPEEMQTISRMIAQTHLDGYTGCCGVLRDTDLRADIHAITAPALVISGTHDPATPPSDGRALCAAVSHSRYVELDASHLSAWECAKEFADAAIAFLGTEERRDG
ncbi:MAG TPA: 3-oxoadipate enol-lactonase [Terracidiphilus sp.]